MAFEPLILRCSAAVAIADPCIPKRVVRLAHRTTCAADQDNPRVSAAQVVRWALVNALGPGNEVKRRTPFPTS